VRLRLCCPMLAENVPLKSERLGASNIPAKDAFHSKLWHSGVTALARSEPSLNFGSPLVSFWSHR
jgi:hypothetical protein